MVGEESLDKGYCSCAEENFRCLAGLFIQKATHQLVDGNVLMRFVRLDVNVIETTPADRYSERPQP
jgi:hypothetical protein